MENAGPSDPELLAEWLEQHREAAFRTLVTRYAGLVLMTARRTCGGDESLAAEASQLTFLLLARKAKSLLTCASLGGWLHRAALMHSKNLLRAEQSETRKREKLLLTMNDHPPASPDDPWQELRPVLDEALAGLPDKYREALLLRFYRSLGVREIGAVLGISTEAAQKRIDRGTERLRIQLIRRGCTAGVSLSAALLAGFAADAKAAATAAPLLASNALAASGAATTAGSSTFITTLSMKAGSYVAPATVVLALAWLAGQRLSLAKLEQENAWLSSKLATVTVPGTHSARRVPTSTELDKRPVDWSEVARKLDEYEGGGGAVYLTSKLRLHDDFRAMSREALIAALDEVAAANLNNSQRGVVEERLYKSLLEKDPEMAMGRVLKGGFSNQAELLGAWARKDAKRAAAWLDVQIATGSLQSKSLDGGSNLRMSFEHSLFEPLISSDTEELSRRLAALPQRKRVVLFDEHALRVKAEDQPAFVRLLREQVPDKARLSVLSEVVLWHGAMGFTEMHEFLQRIEAAPDERDACILAMASGGTFLKKVMEPPNPDPRMGRASYNVASIEDLDALRAWLSTEAPAIVEQACVKTLGSLGRMKYEEVVTLALHCHEAGGSDEVLLAVIDDPRVMDHLELARSVAAKLSDPTKRHNAISRLNHRSEGE